jgi:hypothetical protein
MILIYHVKDEGKNLNTFATTLFNVISCAPLELVMNM